MTTMNIIEFLKENEIKFLPINIKIDKKTGEKKYLEGEDGCFIDGRRNFTRKDFEKWDFDDCVEFFEEYESETNYIGIDCTQIHQLDIDDKTGTFKGSETEAAYTKGPHFLSVSKKLPHIFMRTDYKNQKCAEIPFEHDVLTNVWAFARIDQDVINADQEIPTFTFTPKKEEKKSSVRATPVTTTIAFDPFKKAILDNIDSDKYYKYPEWSKFIWAIKFILQFS